MEQFFKYSFHGEAERMSWPQEHGAMERINIAPPSA
jgi:hypothetical protein